MRSRTAERIRDRWDTEGFSMTPSETSLWNALLKAGGYDDRVIPGGGDEEAEDAEEARIRAMLEEATAPSTSLDRTSSPIA